MFEYYVLHYDWNKKKVEHFNIFWNMRVNEWTKSEVKKYLRAPGKYKYVKQYENKMLGREEIAIYGFEAFCAELRSIFMNQLWSRREYEISVSDAFVTEVRDIVRDLDKYESLEDLKAELIKQDKRNAKLEKWDCFGELEKNIPMIAREVIWQYKEYLKNEKSKQNT